MIPKHLLPQPVLHLMAAFALVLLGGCATLSSPDQRRIAGSRMRRASGNSSRR
jgi:hypothetical protein